MFTSSPRHPIAGLGLLLLSMSLCSSAGTEEKSAFQLKRDLAEKERQSTKVQRDEAEARARLALAEGKRNLAITELRKAVAGYQAEVQWIRDHANWFCDPREPMTQAQWDLAKARVWLAEVEGDTATLVIELKKIVGFHEERLQIARRLEAMLAIKAPETALLQESLTKARERLEDAQKRLSVEESKKAGEKK